ncbi:MAG: hypothetical protein A3C53_08680 [Omnitrophica WOR_2 bacterium RIFCSPHIGHO2_02_FULL_68_15]|nr:MAG: hypothetical protein A3C53_08680 [Omnitrophica WOR_2 bacterium RIFCSPHIGHO2_02_FULL_68_15]
MTQHKTWVTRAREALESTLAPVPHESNELDWKLTTSEDTARLVEHLSAFANHPGGGFLAFGIDATGQIQGVTDRDVAKILQKLGNAVREGLDPPQTIDHVADSRLGHEILLVCVPESQRKPVHLRGKGIEWSYLRSGGQTRKMSRQEIANAILASRQARYEELEALACQASDVLELLDAERILQLLGVPTGGGSSAIIEQLVNQKLLYRHNGGYAATNLGAIAAARDLRRFPGKERFPVRVVKYHGTSRIETETEKEFPAGYGVGFQALIRYIMDQLPTSEIIQDALRKNAAIYPEITIRELVANALIHRDCTITRTNPMVEIFADRMEILNPGPLLPSIRVERLIDSAPESRNELLASLMRRMGICEERGSGIDKALFAVELYGLPPLKFESGPNAFRVTLYSPKRFPRMTHGERLDACYQHCCLRFVSGEFMTNASLRRRLGLKDGQYATAWRVIEAAEDRKLIKPRDLRSASKRYASYVPFWA